jgi:hypothetical protein
VRPARRQTPRALVVALGVVLVAWTTVVVATLWSFGSYVLRDNGDTMQQRAVTWARDHRLGWAVDRLEDIAYSSPPSRTAASQLSLGGAAVSSPTTAAAPTTVPEATPAVTTTVPEATPAVTTTVPATTTTIPARTTAAPWAPAALAPVVTPALPGEGTWDVIGVADGTPAIWATSLRPLADYPSVVASLALIDQTHLRSGLFNGNEVPGGQDWRRGDRVPAVLHPALLAAFNGGFRLDNIKGGYATEGRVVKPLVAGEATLAVSRDGTLVIGELGRDLTDDGTWLSLRQNLPLMVDGGESQVGNRAGVWWGADYHNKIYVTRSAVCTLADGHFVFTSVGPVDAPMLGRALVGMGCVRAMELDINGTWPTFITFSADQAGHLRGAFLDRRMGGSPNRYLSGSSREFFALFDASRVAPASVLDGP